MTQENSGMTSKGACLICGGYHAKDLECEIGAAYDQAPETAQEHKLSDKLREKVRDAIAETLCDAMDCTRVWNAWNVGTMTQDDFRIINEDEERLMEIVDAAIRAMQPPSPIAEQAIQVDEQEKFEVWFCNYVYSHSYNDSYTREIMPHMKEAWDERASIARGEK